MVRFKLLYIRHIQCRLAGSKKIALAALLCLISMGALANNDNTKRPYYRYYDSNGIANISRSVTPQHIRRGYEVLDGNMYLIKKIPPYNVEADLRQENVRAVQSERERQDQQIKRSFRNVKYASQKKIETINVLQKQLVQQYQNMRQLQADRSNFLQQKANFVLERRNIPDQLAKKLENNETHIKNTRQSIEQTKNTLAAQEQYFDYIISRLQTME